MDFSLPTIFIGGITVTVSLIWCCGAFARLLAGHRAEAGFRSVAANDDLEEEAEMGKA